MDGSGRLEMQVLWTARTPKSGSKPLWGPAVMSKCVLHLVNSFPVNQVLKISRSVWGGENPCRNFSASWLTPCNDQGEANLRKMAALWHFAELSKSEQQRLKLDAGRHVQRDGEIL